MYGYIHGCICFTSSSSPYKYVVSKVLDNVVRSPLRRGQAAAQKSDVLMNGCNNENKDKKCWGK